MINHHIFKVFSILKYNLLGLHSRNGHELWWRLCQQTGKIQMGNIINGNIFNKHNDQEKKTLVKRIFFSCMEFIQFKLLCFYLILYFWRWKVFPLCLCTLWIYRMTSLISCCVRIVNQNKWPTVLHDRADVTVGFLLRIIFK